MDEKKRILEILEQVETELNDFVTNEIEVKAAVANHTSPIYGNLARFHNEKIGDKFSVKDLFRLI